MGRAGFTRVKTSMLNNGPSCFCFQAEGEKNLAETIVPKFLKFFQRLLKENGDKGFFVGSAVSTGIRTNSARYDRELVISDIIVITALYFVLSPSSNSLYTTYHAPPPSQKRQFATSSYFSGDSSVVRAPDS